MFFLLKKRKTITEEVITRLFNSLRKRWKLIVWDKQSNSNYLLMKNLIIQSTVMVCCLYQRWKFTGRSVMYRSPHWILSCKKFIIFSRICDHWSRLLLNPQVNNQTTSVLVSKVRAKAANKAFLLNICLEGIIFLEICHVLKLSLKSHNTWYKT